MHRGYTKDYRKVKEWEWYKTPNMYHLFNHLIREANHKDGRWQGHEVKRGQLITGILTLSLQTGISTQSIRTCLQRLKSTGEITIHSTNKYSIITICCYDIYQCEEIQINNQNNNQPNKQLTNNQQTTNKQLTTNKNDKNDKNEKNIIKPDGVSELVWNDFLSHRKANKAKLTETALNAIMKESEKAGWTLEQALTECVQRGWKGFKAEWVKDKPSYSQQFKPKTSNRNIGTHNENVDYSIFDKTGK